MKPVYLVEGSTVLTAYWLIADRFIRATLMKSGLLETRSGATFAAPLNPVVTTAHQVDGAMATHLWGGGTNNVNPDRLGLVGIRAKEALSGKGCFVGWEDLLNHPNIRDASEQSKVEVKLAIARAIEIAKENEA